MDEALLLDRDRRRAALHSAGELLGGVGGRLTSARACQCL